MILQPEIRVGDDWDWQAEAYNFCYPRTDAMLAMDMGTGKSRVVVNLAQNWGVQTTLIICPAKVLGIWRREFHDHAAIKFHMVILDKGTVAAKTTRAAKQIASARAKGLPVVVVVGYESARAKAFYDWSLKQHWDLVVLDESHRAKSATTTTGKYAYHLRKCSDRRLCLTGTPMPHSPLDLFSQARFLNPVYFGDRWSNFRYRYAIFHNMFPSKVIQWKNQDHLKQVFSEFAFRVKSDVLDLPGFEHRRVPVVLDAKTLGIYKEFEEEMVAMVEGGVLSAGNGLVKILRMQQLTSGVVRPDDSETWNRIDYSKATELSKLLMTDIPTGEKVVVFCRFTSDLEAVQEVAAGYGLRYGEVRGGHSDLTSHGEMPEDIDIMGVQIQAGGVGIDLTRAAHCIYMSVGHSLGDYLQSLKRVHRPKQTRDVKYYHLVAQGTIDEVVYKSLQNKEDLIEGVMEALSRSKTEKEEFEEFDEFASPF